MPSELAYQFIQEVKQEDSKHQHRNFQMGAIYAITTAESGFWRPRGGLESGTKIRKTTNLCERANQYLTYFPWQKPYPLKFHCLILADYRTQEDKNRLGRMETFVLSTLKEMYPEHKYHPGIPEKYRLHFSRSEWIQGVPVEEIEDVFQRCAKEFGSACLYVKISSGTNIPRIWYAWRDRFRAHEAAVKRKMQEEQANKEEARGRAKRARYQPTERKYTTTAEDRTKRMQAGGDALHPIIV